MKNKIIVTFMFFLFFIFFVFITNSSAYTVTVDDHVYDFGDIKFDYFDTGYTFVYNNPSDRIVNIYSFNNEPILKKSGDFYVLDCNTKYHRCYCYKKNGNVYEVNSVLKEGEPYGVFFASNFISSTFDIKDKDGYVVFEKSSEFIKNPFIVNKDEFLTGNFSNLIINTGDYSVEAGFTLTVNELIPTQVDSNVVYYPSRSKKFDLNNSFEGLTVNRADGTNSVFTIPSSKLFVFNEGNMYEFILNQNGSEVLNENFICSAIPVVDKEQQEEDKKIELQEELNETNKGIFESIKEVLSYINPFSENFFVYKLIELLVEAIKGLFFPSENFFNNWVSDMNDWLGDRLGILYYPVDLVVMFLEKIGEISENNSAVISWNNFDFMGATLIQAGSYDLNSLLANDTLNSIHSIYLVFTDIILWLGLLFLAKNTFVDIFGGKYDEMGDYIEGAYNTASAYDKKHMAEARAERRRNRAKLR